VQKFVNINEPVSVTERGLAGFSLSGEMWDFRASKSGYVINLALIQFDNAKKG